MDVAGSLGLSGATDEAAESHMKGSAATPALIGAPSIDAEQGLAATRIWAVAARHSSWSRGSSAKLARPPAGDCCREGGLSFAGRFSGRDGHRDLTRQAGSQMHRDGGGTRYPNGSPIPGVVGSGRVGSPSHESRPAPPAATAESSHGISAQRNPPAIEPGCWARTVNCNVFCRTAHVDPASEQRKRRCKCRCGVQTRAC